MSPVTAIISIQSKRIIYMSAVNAIPGCIPQICNIILSDTLRFLTVIVTGLYVIDLTLPLFVIRMTCSGITRSPVL